MSSAPSPVLAAIERTPNPVSLCMMGANINRDTRQNIEKASREIEQEKNHVIFNIFQLFITKKR